MSDTQIVLLYPFLPMLTILLIYLATGADKDDDDQDGGKGMMQPIYSPVPSGA
jgi:hypothetical protein